MPSNNAKFSQLNLLGGFLLIAGIISTLMASLSLISGAGQLSKARAMIDQQIAQVTSIIEQKGLPTEPLQEISSDLSRRLSELQQLSDSFGMHLGYGIQLVLGLGTFISGFGFLKRKPWVIPWVKGQAIVAASFYAWWILGSPMAAFRREMTELMLSLFSRVAAWSVQVQWLPVVEWSQRLSLWLGLAFAFAWNGFLFWYVRKSDVQQACRVGIK